MKKSTFNILSAIIFAISIAILASITIPLITSYDNPAEFEKNIAELGIGGFLLMFFLQISQTIVALIPGEFVEFVAGALYGCIGGLIFCMAGIIVGQSIIFHAVKFLGRNFAEKVAGSKIMTKYKFLQDERKLKSLIFFLFFIPGTPKDMLTYLVPLTKIKFRDFIYLTALARIPSVVSSTLAGAAFSENNLLVLICTYGVIGIFSLTGTILYKYAYLNRKSSTAKKAANDTSESSASSLHEDEKLIHQ